MTADQPMSTGAAPGGAADHDVALGGALEPQRVDAHIEEAGREGEGRRQQVDEPPQPGEGHGLDADGEDQGAARRHDADHEGPVLGALHQPVDVAIDVHVDGVGPARRQRPADHGGDHQPQRGQAPLGDDHRGHRRHEQQFDDAGLRRARRNRVRVLSWRTLEWPVARSSQPALTPPQASIARLRADVTLGHIAMSASRRDRTLAMTPAPRRRITLATYRRITLLALLALAVIVVSGAAVRLTGSGLGCEDWPRCSENAFVRRRRVPRGSSNSSTACSPASSRSP